MNLHKTILYIAILSAAVIVVACARPERQPLSQLDTPDHHTYTGMRLLGQQQYDEAEREFNLAIQLDERFSGAYRGIGLVKAYRGEYDAAAQLMHKARILGATNRDKSLSSAGLLRIALMHQHEGWLDDAKRAFNEAVKTDPDLAEAYYFMGHAYKQALEFGKAEKMFSRVLELQQEYVKEADMEWKRIQNIQRAMPGTITGKKIAIAESLTRADMAALLLEELKIDTVYKKFGVTVYAKAFTSPDETAKYEQQQECPSDVVNHVLANDICGILKIGIRGLEVYPDGSYRPDDQITRAAFAMIVEDILIKIGHDDALATRFIGAPSPFSDVRNDMPYFNAVMVVTARGIMEVRDTAANEFGPRDPVMGADALLILRKIKEDLKIF